MAKWLEVEINSCKECTKSELRCTGAYRFEWWCTDENRNRKIPDVMLIPSFCLLMDVEKPIYKYEKYVRKSSRCW